MSAFVAAGSYEDGGYIAECVLTSDELINYVEQLPASARETIVSLMNWTNYQGTVQSFFAQILARKLAREDRFEEAHQFDPDQPYLRYSRLISTARAGRIPKYKRAELLFEAARLAREHGMEMFGTRFAPDWKRYDGDRVPTGRSRMESGTAQSGEALRVISNRPYPNRRFHYRWTASELMWECAQLLPNNSDTLAQALWYGGTYIAIEDPEGADKFYKALVRRCGALEVAKEADRRRWFPPQPSHWTYPVDRVWR